MGSNEILSGRAARSCGPDWLTSWGWMLRWLDQRQARAHLYRQLGQQPRQEKHAQGPLSFHGPGRVGRPVVSQIGKLHLRTHLRTCCSFIAAERHHVGTQFQSLFNHVEDVRSFALILCRGFSARSKTRAMLALLFWHTLLQGLPIAGCLAETAVGPELGMRGMIQGGCLGFYFTQRLLLVIICAVEIAESSVLQILTHLEGELVWQVLSNLYTCHCCFIGIRPA